MQKKEVVFDYSKLKGYMAEHEITQRNLAEKSNVSLVTINQNLKHGKSFRMENIPAMAKALGINPQDIAYYFFRIKGLEKI